MTYLTQVVTNIRKELDEDIVALSSVTLGLYHGFGVTSDTSKNYSDFASEVARELLHDEHIRVASFTETGLEPWPTSTNESVERIRKFLLSLDRTPNAGDNVWFLRQP
ncbi:MAG: hypothetical protein ABSB70_12335 [Candidatus Velthaea sp.]|jgi:hypothetical protein